MIQCAVSTLRRLLGAAMVGLCLACSAGAAPALDDAAQTIVHMLDYVGVDYAEAVDAGRIKNADEYKEMVDFAAQVHGLLASLPAIPARATLQADAGALAALIDAKAAPAEIAQKASALRWAVIRAYGLQVAPKSAPDLRVAAALYATHCAACHGAQGRGDGPAGQALEPAPSNFHDRERMAQRSVYGLYNTITLGVAGTAMRGFTELTEADRWALAFLASAMGTEPAQITRGESLWAKGTGKAEFGDLRRLVTSTPADLGATGRADLVTVRAYLVAEPGAAGSAAPPPLALARAKLIDALAAYRAGDRAAARQHAITAYLEGFELVESSLDNVNPALRRKTEAAMMALRTDIDAGQPVDAFSQRVEQVNALLDDANSALSAGEMSSGTAFTSSLLILLREGLEAILVLAAIIAFVRKTGRRDALPYVHFGWIAAVVLGAATWFVANRFIAISGASRELTEGFSALLAAAMLLYVGLWLHNRSHAQAWQGFIREQVTGALAKRTLWAMTGISFLAVYRELFEVILFYETLLAQAGDAQRPAVLGGIGVGAVLLALLGGVILKYSARLPIGLFFTATSWLLVAMAVIFVGHGVAALQEAGVIGSTPVPFVALPALGLHPNAQGLAAQGAMLMVTVGVLLLGRRSQST